MTNEEAIKLIDDRMCFGRGKWSRHHQPVIDEYWQAGEMAIKALKAEPHWIPVTERLPVEEGRYLVCGKKGGIYHANYRGRWWTQVGCGGKLVPSVVAWMPLPEPYKGVTE